MDQDQIQETYDEVLPSSPEGSIIEIPSSSVHNNRVTVNNETEGQTEAQYVSPGADMTEFNTIDEHEIILINDESTTKEGSSLMEISQSQFQESQKKNDTNNSNEIPILSSPLKSQIITSSSPLRSSPLRQPPTQPISNNANKRLFKDTQISTIQETETVGSEDAQRTTDGVSSPVRIAPESIVNSPFTTPTKKRRRLLSQSILPITNTESFNIIKSSPVSSSIAANESVYLTAREPEFETRVSRVEFKGVVKPSAGSAYDTFKTSIKRISPVKEIEEIPDSQSDDDDEDISIIEIIKTVRSGFKPRSEVQVPSSQREDFAGLNSSPIANSVYKSDLEFNNELEGLNHDELRELEELNEVEILRTFHGEDEQRRHAQVDVASSSPLMGIRAVSRSKNKNKNSNSIVPPTQTQQTESQVIASQSLIVTQPTQTYDLDVQLEALPLTSPTRSQCNQTRPQDEKYDDEEEDDLDGLSTDALKSRIISYGLKPMRSRAKMIQALRAVNSQLSQPTILQLSQGLSNVESTTSTLLNVNQSVRLIKFEIFNKINECLSMDPVLLQDIAIFKPVRLSRINGRLDKSGVRIEESFVKQFCDEMSITVVDDVNIRESEENRER